MRHRVRTARTILAAVLLAPLLALALATAPQAGAAADLHSRLAPAASVSVVTTAQLGAAVLPATTQLGAVVYYPWQATYARVNVYGRTSPSTSASTVYLYQGGQVVYYTCWTTGTPVNGDTVWYLTRPNPSLPQYQGYVAGWWLETGADPDGKVGHC